jgi:hypothetical protein
MITPLGSVSIGVAVPAAVDLSAGLLTTANIALPNVNGQIAAMADFTPVVAVPFPDLLALAEQVVANVQAAIDAIPPIPVVSLSAQVALAASILANFNAQAAAIDAQLTLQATIAGFLATGGVAAYAFDGPQDTLGSELATALGPATTHANAIVLVTTSGAAWTAMQGVFKTTP